MNVTIAVAMFLECRHVQCRTYADMKELFSNIVACFNVLKGRYLNVSCLTLDVTVENGPIMHI